VRCSWLVYSILLLPLVGQLALSADTAKKAAAPAKNAEPAPWATPELPGGKSVVTDKSNAFLKSPPGVLSEGVTIAKGAPTIDFLFCPGQDYQAKIWSNWGDSLAVNGKYYSAIGDHNGPEGNAFVYEYDPATKSMRTIVDLKKLLQMPRGHYAPGKIHSRIDLGKDGYLYFSTHRGATTVTNDQYHYQGDWIVRVDPASGKVEAIAHGPAGKHCMPASVLDPDRLIYYAGTAPGSKADGGIQFLAYDVQNKKNLYLGPNGPNRVMIFARSTGKVYFVPLAESGQLVRFDPANPSEPTPINATVNMRACTEETAGGLVYLLGHTKEKGTHFARFNTKTETVEELGAASVASMEYITTIDVDSTGRYVYYVPGARGGAQKDGSPVVQYDTKTGQRKVLAFVSPFYKDKYQADLVGTFATAIDPKGDKLYVTWNVDRGVARGWDCCAVTVIHIPESERPQ